VSAGRLDPAERRRSLDRLRSSQLDVLVIGGGVVGAGAALDAASRGLTVGLLEKDDWASGTSSRSSRLAHGGLRYLEQREFALVHEALTERGLLLERLAPHLVRPVPFVFPLTRALDRPYVGAGIAIYDVLARVGRRTGGLPGHRHLSRSATLRLAPGLREDAFTGAVGFFDAQIDDARHTVALVRTAATHGALTVSRAQVEQFRRDDGRVVGVTALDRETGERFDVSAHVVVGATGVWTTHTRTLLDESVAADVRPSKGVHLVVDRDAIALNAALIARTTHSVLFLLPWGRHWLVGTTDTPWDGSLEDPEPTGDDIDYLLAEANKWLARPLRRDDVKGTFAGLRPLLAVDPDTVDDTTKLSREHAVSTPAPGFVDIAGGKYTTYRVMAKDVIDEAVRHLPEVLRPGPSRTHALPLVGAEGYAELWRRRHDIAADHDIPVGALVHLLRRHGDEYRRILQLAADDPMLGAPLHPEAPYWRAEVVHAVAAEGARTTDDVLRRRTRLAIEVADGGESVLDDVRHLMALAGATAE
jgi:glycerol-3-phosphate dehydrogenase